MPYIEYQYISISVPKWQRVRKTAPPLTPMAMLLFVVLLPGKVRYPKRSKNGKPQAQYLTVMVRGGVRNEESIAGVSGTKCLNANIVASTIVLSV